MRLNLNLFSIGASAFMAILLTTGCTKDEGIKPQDDAAISQRGLTNGTPVSTALIGLSPNNELVNLMSGPPVVDQGTVTITGLRVEEIMLAIDTRPRTHELFGISSQSVLYRIDPTSGKATPVSGQPLNPQISGDMVGFDFNPTDDMIRLISSTGQNLRISPTTGAVVGVDVQINSFTAAINSVAYSYTLAGSRSTLYDLDIAGSTLYKQSNPNSGALQFVGLTNFFFTGEGGFDITPANVGFTIQYGRSRVQTGGGGLFGNQGDTTQDAYRLYNVDLRTGKLTSYGKVRPMIGLAVK